jgi:hypothetical protein
LQRRSADRTSLSCDQKPDHSLCERTNEQNDRKGKQPGR